MTLMRSLMRPSSARTLRAEQLSSSIVVQGCLGHGKRATEFGSGVVRRRGGLRALAGVLVVLFAGPPPPEQPPTTTAQSMQATGRRTREVSHRHTGGVRAEPASCARAPAQSRVRTTLASALSAWRRTARMPLASRAEAASDNAFGVHVERFGHGFVSDRSRPDQAHSTSSDEDSSR
jgi:hypothetical protein